MQYIIKLIVTTLAIVVISEIAKRFTVWATILASLPLVSIISIIWLYSDTKNVNQVIDFSSKMFWATLPSLLFFIVFPYFLKSGFPFIASLSLSIIIMIIAYLCYIAILKYFNITL